MHPSQRIVSRLDRLRLHDAIFELGHATPHAAAVRDLLNWAAAVAPSAVPHDIITMNSTVRLRNLATGCSATCTLVYPGEPAHSGRGLSVFSALGSTLFARRVGEASPWHGTEGTAQIIIDALAYQPERAGDFDR